MQKGAPYRILVIEDEENIAELICLTLERAGFSAESAPSGEEGLRLLAQQAYDLVILDIALPGISGYDVCRTLRTDYKDTAIIMVTARGTDRDRIAGLELGADDYMVKPFVPDELNARVRSVLRRTRREDGGAAFSIDISGRRVYRSGREVKLTAKEYDLLHYLYERRGKAISRQELLHAVWGEDFFGEEKTLDVHIRRLREKIEEEPSKPKRISTVWAVGFRYDGEA